jgi:hypothetical protein
MDLHFRLWTRGKTASTCTSAAQMVSLARLICEMYLVLAAGEGNPRQRYERLLCLHRAGEHKNCYLCPSPKNSTAHPQR